jgi:hypothetical protein
MGLPRIFHPPWTLGGAEYRLWALDSSGQRIQGPALPSEELRTPGFEDYPRFDIEDALVNIRPL